GLPRVVGALDDAQQRTAAAGEHPPPTRAGGELSGRRVAGIPDREMPGLQVDGDVDGGREALGPAQPEHVVVRGLEGTTLAHLAAEAAEGAGQQQRASARLAALARHVDESDLEAVAVGRAARDDEVAREAVTVGRLQGDLGAPRRWQRWQLALRTQPVAHVD